MGTLRIKHGFFDRFRFGRMLTRWGITAPAVEVGTLRGVFAEHLLATWKGALTCVDPWRNYNNFLLASGRLERFGSRCRLLMLPSEKAVVKFRDESLGFCYIDGDHKPESARFDLSNWWPKLISGGILAGHDFISVRPESYEVDALQDRSTTDRWVQPEVLEFAERTGVPLYLVPEPSLRNWSFYLIKS